MLFRLAEKPSCKETFFVRCKKALDSSVCCSRLKKELERHKSVYYKCGRTFGSKEKRPSNNKLAPQSEKSTPKEANRSTQQSDQPSKMQIAPSIKRVNPPRCKSTFNTEKSTFKIENWCISEQTRPYTREFGKNRGSI